MNWSCKKKIVNMSTWSKLCITGHLCGESAWSADSPHKEPVIQHDISWGIIVMGVDSAELFTGKKICSPCALYWCVFSTANCLILWTLNIVQLPLQYVIFGFHLNTWKNLIWQKTPDNLLRQVSNGVSSHLICDVMRTQVTGIVTSYSSIILARANWVKGDLH